jgi:Tfp pilus assembly protein PilF
LAGILKKEDRTVIPRWRTFSDSAERGELDYPKQRVAPPEDFLSDKEQAWRENRTIWHAADFLGAAVALRRANEAQDAAVFLQANEYAPAPAKRLAQRVLAPTRETPSERSTTPERDIRADIHRTREFLVADPRNSIQWVELAREYTISGLRKRAERAINIALSLTKHNRFVLRCAARFFLHNDEPEKAHYILRTASSSKADPWIAAAEIAVASTIGANSRVVDSGRKLLSSGDHAPFDVTELASALATLELANGKNKAARNLFKTSLVQPTENSLAQAEWAVDKVRGLEVSVEDYAVPGKYEAAAWDYFNKGDWELSLANAKAWLYDQPFSSRPAMLASYLTISVLERIEEGIGLLEESLKANPNHSILLNNLAFGLANLGKPQAAEEKVRLIDTDKLSKVDRAVVTATKGLIAYRNGDIELGRTLYTDALRMAKEAESPKLYAEGLLYFAQEELRAKTPSAREIFAETLKVAEEHDEPIMRRLTDLLWRTAREAQLRTI